MELRELTLEELKQNIGLLSYAYDANKDLFPCFFEYEYEGETKYLYCFDNWFTVLSKKSDRQYNYYGFSLNENYELMHSGYDKFYVMHNSNNIQSIISDSDKMCFALQYGKREESDGVSDGYVAFTQTKFNSCDSLSMVYSTYYMEGRKLYKGHLNKAHLYYYKKHLGRTSKYLRKDIDFREEPSLFNIISMREYGLFNVLKNGAISLQRNDRLGRYFKLPFESDILNVSCRFFSPFYKNFDEETFNQMILDNGFFTEIPDYVLDYYNGGYKQLEEYKALAVAIKSYYQKNNKVLVLNLDREVI